MERSLGAIKATGGMLAVGRAGKLVRVPLGREAGSFARDSEFCGRVEVSDREMRVTGDGENLQDDRQRDRGGEHDPRSAQIRYWPARPPSPHLPPSAPASTMASRTPAPYGHSNNLTGVADMILILPDTG